MPLQRAGTWGFLAIVALTLVGCSNGSGSVEESSAASGGSAGGSPPVTGGSSANASSYTVSATVSGLVGDGLVLQNNGADDIPVAANGRLTFGEPLASGAAYNVTILSQPTNPTQSCSVVGGIGTIGNADVTNVSIACTTPNAQSFSIGGVVTGLQGSGLLLQNNGGDNLSIAADGEFTFATPLATGSDYAVTVVTQPANPAQTCSVNNNAGTVGTADVTNVAVTCSGSSFSVGFSVSGLRGTGLQLQLNGNETLSASGNGSYAFTQLVANGAPYSVAVITQPTSPKQTCVVSNPAGVINGANVSNVTVSCTTDQSIGGTVKGLAGSGLVLQLNGANNLTVTRSGSFQFSTVLPSGSQYSVTVATQPSNPTQECTVKNGSGVVRSAPITNIGVDCVTKQFKLIANVTGLQGKGLRLRNDIGKNKEEIGDIDANGTYEFKPLLSGTRYSISVKAPSKPRQECVVDNPTGTIGAADVTLNVTCKPPTEFAVSGTISGLQGQGLQLQNNGADTLSLAAGATSFEFAGLVAIGNSYNVTVAAQPTSPWQDCVVTGGSGSMGSGDVSNVSVACTTRSFTIGGTATGLFFPFNGVVRLQLNGGAEFFVTADQPVFTFPTTVESGASYTVTVIGPSNCTVSNGTGIVQGANIENVAVSC